MRGTLGAVVRTVLMIGGFVMLLAGIVTLAYPPSLTAVAPGDGTATTPSRGPGPQQPGGAVGPTLFVSLGGVIWGLTLVSAGLAVPGRSSYWLVAEQPFTRRQRVVTLLGSFLVVGLPLVVWSAVQTGLESVALILATALLAVVGAVLVLVGAVRGLKYRPRARQNS